MADERRAGPPSEAIKVTVRGMSHIFSQTLAVFVFLPFTACSLSNFVADESIDYNATVEKAVTNDVPVTNILRARDGAPLFFSAWLKYERRSRSIVRAGDSHLARRTGLQTGTVSIAHFKSAPSHETIVRVSILIPSIQSNSMRGYCSVSKRSLSILLRSSSIE